MKQAPFGSLPTGESIESYTLENANGVSMRAITYGATITSLKVPDREGRLADVVLGFDALPGYLAWHPYFGAMVGRVAGRISGARFELEGRTYDLAPNDPPNHLHGGNVGFSRKVWTASSVDRLDGASSLRFAYRSPDGQEGYPGTVEAEVTYTLTADNAVMVETMASTDQATPFSLTHHSYFNLSGEGSESINDHELQIHATDFAPTDGHLTLLGRRESALGKPNDFTAPRVLREAILGLHQGHGDLYFVPAGLREANLTPEPVACLYAPASGRLLSVSTTEDCIQLYTGIGLDGTLVGKSHRAYGPCAGLCLECEGYPDGPNVPALGDIILRPGQPRCKTTIYAFSTR